MFRLACHPKSLPGVIAVTVALILAGAAGGLAESPPSISPLSFELKAGQRTTVIATQVPKGGQLTLHLVDPESGEAGPAMLADIDSIAQGQVRLTPRFNLVAGATYRARLADGDKVVATADLVLSSATGAVPVVEAIHPADDQLPANLLKFYISFSEPMRQGRDIFDRIHIEDEAGKRVEAPWRRRELWSDDHRRLTLWIHPGRVKQGVNLRTTMGPVLLPDRRYTLVADAGILSLPGKPTVEPKRKAFTTLAEDHQRPSATDWRLSLPPAGSREALQITVPDALDHALVARYLSVTDAAGDPVPLAVTMADSQRVWRLTPDNPWQDETYTLHAGEFLEDLAGNTPIRVFDTDLSVPIAEPTEADLERQFRPASAR